MIDLTPLDVRNKRGDFKKGMRGYDPQEVDVFLELVAERLEALVRENIQLRDRTRTLQEQVDAQAGREQAVQDALVTAQELRKDMREQSQREADHLMREAESEARRIVSEAEAEARARVRGVERQIDHARDSLKEMERRRNRFLQEFRGLLQRELDVVEVEEERTPLEDRAIDLDLGAARIPSSRKAADSGDGRAADSAEVAASSRSEASDAPGAEASDAPGGGASTTTAGEEEPGSPAASDAGDSREGGEASGPAATAAGTSADGAGDGGSSGSDEAAPGASMSSGSSPSVTAEVTPGDREEALEADVGELAGREGREGRRPAAPSPEVGDAPSSLELELMAGAAGGGASTDSDAGTDSESRRPAFPDVPDLETVLAEAGIDEVRPPDAEEISPPPAEADAEDRLKLFDKDEEDGKR